MARKKTTAAETPGFEEALARLEAVVRELEEADLPLERSLAVFEEGVRLSRLLHERLNQAERRIEILMKEGDEKVAVPFAPGADRPRRGGGALKADEAAAEDENDDDDDDDDGGDDDGGEESPAGRNGQDTLF